MSEQAAFSFRVSHEDLLFDARIHWEISQNRLAYQQGVQSKLSLSLSDESSMDDFIMLIHPEDQNGFHWSLSQFLLKPHGGVWQSHFRLRMRDLTYREVLLRGQVQTLGSQVVTFSAVLIELSQILDSGKRNFLRMGSELQKLAKVGAFELDAQSLLFAFTEGVSRVLSLEPGASLSLAELTAKITPEQRTLFMNGVEDCLKEGTLFDEDLKFSDAMRNEKTLRVFLAAQRDEQGSITHLSGIIQDISERGERRH